MVQVRSQQSAFLVNHSVALDHYQPILENLDPASVSLLFADDSKISDEPLREELARRLGGQFEILSIQEALDGCRRWNLGVSIITFDRDICRRIFKTWVKLEHGIYDVGGASFSKKNLLFDAVLCHGPYSSERIERCYGVKTYQVGYPRYSRAVQDIDSIRNSVRSALGVHEDQSLVLWLPTVDRENSINSFVDEFLELPDKIYVLAKLHPMTASTHPDQLRRIEDSKVRLLSRDSNIELQDLIISSDVTVHDQGGTGLASIYLRANPIFLEIPDHMSTANGERTPEAIVRSTFGAVKPGNLSLELAKALNASQFDSAESMIRKDLREIFFADQEGTDGLAAARVINHLASRSWLLTWADSSPTSRLIRRLLANLRHRRKSMGISPRE